MKLFAHRLALCLGRTVGELFSALTWEEFLDWVAFDMREPLPDPWLSSATVAAVVANTIPRSSGPAFRARDFIPTRWTPPKATTAAKDADQTFAFQSLKAELMGAFHVRNVHVDESRS